LRKALKKYLLIFIILGRKLSCITTKGIKKRKEGNSFNIYTILLGLAGSAV
jgi:hypothetical protein